MKITFIGTSACIPDVGSEVASFLIDGKVLVDTVEALNEARAVFPHSFLATEGKTLEI